MKQVSTMGDLWVLPYAGCCLKLRNVEVNLRSSKAATVASYSCGKPTFLVRRLIGVCSRGRLKQNEHMVAKSRPARNSVSLNLNRSPTLPSSRSSQSPENLTATLFNSVFT